MTPGEATRAGQPLTGAGESLTTAKRAHTFSHPAPLGAPPAAITWSGEVVVLLLIPEGVTFERRQPADTS